MEKAELTDGKVQTLPETVGATYFFRTLEASSARSLNVSFGSDVAIKVWLNGQEVLSKFVTRGAEADQELLELKLDAGRNELLIKIVNTGGIGGFYFQRLSESQLGLPSEVVTALQVAEVER